MRFFFNILIIFLPFSAFSQNINLIKDLNDAQKKTFLNLLQKDSKVSIFSIQHQHYLDSIITILPKDPFYLQQKAMPLFKQKKYELGLIYLNKAVELDTTNFYREYRAFIKCIFQKNYTEANQEFDWLISKYSNGIVMDHTYYFYKALSLLQLNRLDEAEDQLKKSFKYSLDNKFDPNPTELFYMGIIFYEKEQYEIAIKYFDDCLKQYPQFSDALYYKAKCKYYLKDKIQALALLKEVRSYYSQGYSINEANAFYEDYPYQIKKWIIDDAIGQIGGEN